ncbi:MAG: CvpA family protein [Salegentibacter sp.]
MNTVDIILALILLYGFIRGFMRGFLGEVASLIGIIAGIFGAIHFSYFAGEFLRRHLDWDPEYVYLLAFAITFLVIVIAISLVGKVLTKIAGLAALGMLNRIFGAFFGFLKVAFVLSVILMFFNASRQDFELIPDKTLENSVLLPPVEAVAPVLLPTILDQARQHGILKKSEDLGIKKES